MIERAPAEPKLPTASASRPIFRRVAIAAFLLAIATACTLSIRSSLGAGGFASVTAALSHLHASKLTASIGFVVAIFYVLWLLEQATLKLTRVPSDAKGVAPRALIAISVSLGAGFGLLSGGALRARLYGPLGIDAPTAIYIATMATIASLLGGGLIAAAGLALNMDRGFFGAAARPVGLLALCGLAGLVIAAGRTGRVVHVAGRRMELPSAGPLAALVIIGALDWLISAAALFVLLPDEGRLPYPDFAALFTLSHYVGMATGAPAGLGVFDALLLRALGRNSDAASLAAAVLAYRIVALVAPVSIGAVGLVAIEARGATVGRAPRKPRSNSHGALMHWILQRLIRTAGPGASSVTKDELFAAAAQAPSSGLQEITRGGPILIMAPHPDDDILGCGGLIAACTHEGIAVHIVYLTDGRHSHIGARQWTAERLAAVRRQEAIAGARLLGVHEDNLTFLNAPDGALIFLRLTQARALNALAALTTNLGARRIFTTWVHDAHPDHVAAGLMGESLGKQLTGVDVLQYPVWGRVLPGRVSLWDGPWRALRFDTRPFTEIKRLALSAHSTQVTALIERPLITMSAPPTIRQACVAGDEIFFVKER